MQGFYAVCIQHQRAIQRHIAQGINPCAKFRVGRSHSHFEIGRAGIYGVAVNAVIAQIGQALQIDLGFIGGQWLREAASEQGVIGCAQATRALGFGFDPVGCALPGIGRQADETAIFGIKPRPVYPVTQAIQSAQVGDQRRAFGLFAAQGMQDWRRIGQAFAEGISQNGMGAEFEESGIFFTGDFAHGVGKTHGGAHILRPVSAIERLAVDAPARDSGIERNVCFLR